MLRHDEISRPAPGPGQVLVEIHAAGVNPVDWKIREGYLRNFLPVPQPYIPGAEVAGTVAAVGSAVSTFAVGDAVYGVVRLNEGGGYAEYVAVPAGQLAPKPAGLSFAEAAALPIGTLTAWQALDNAGLQAGHSVLVHAAAGGVGAMAVQLAKAFGASRVVGTASGRNLDFVRRLGADQVVDYTQERFEQVVAPVDIVLDPVGGEVQRRSFAVLRPGGFLVSVVGPPSAELAAHYGVRVGQGGAAPDVPRLYQLNELLAQGKVRPVVGTVWPLAEAAQALHQSQHGPVQGKIVLLIKSSA